MISANFAALGAIGSRSYGSAATTKAVIKKKKKWTKKNRLGEQKQHIEVLGAANLAQHRYKGIRRSKVRTLSNKIKHRLMQNIASRNYDIERPARKLAVNSSRDVFKQITFSSTVEARMRRLLIISKAWNSRNFLLKNDEEYIFDLIKVSHQYLNLESILIEYNDESIQNFIDVNYGYHWFQ